MSICKTNEQAFEWLIERALVGSTREEREAAGQTDVARQQATGQGRSGDGSRLLS